MARYVVLLNWTDQGARNVKETVQRARAARQAFEAMGVRMADISWTLGQYDVVVTLEAKDDETATRAGLALAAQGNVHSTTLRAFNEKEMEEILRGLP
jgi:uncharacterized protein with GYD domain